MQAYARVDTEPSGILVEEEEEVQQQQQPRSKPSAVGRAVRKAVKCCICAPITCAIRTVLAIVAVVLIVVVVLTLGLYLGLNQTDTGSAMVGAMLDQMKSSIMSKVLTVVDDASRRHRFSTLDSPALLPLALGPWGDLQRRLATSATWAGWLDLQPQSVKYNLTGGDPGAEPMRVVLAAWDVVARSHLWLLPLNVEAGVAWPTTLPAETWSSRPSALLAVLVVPARTIPAVTPSPASWDQIAGQAVALARIL